MVFLLDNIAVRIYRYPNVEYNCGEIMLLVGRERYGIDLKPQALKALPFGGGTQIESV